MIDAVEFGYITIKGKRYRSDVLIYPDGRIEDSWWRKKGHSLFVEDIQDLVASKPEIIIAGTGIAGRMIPSSDLKKKLTEKNIRFVAAPNQQAKDLVNENWGKIRTGACFHLTC
jgi:hypothetical protein